MKQYQAYLIDLDGTMYRGNEKIEDAALFVKKLADKNIPYLFLTNNSAKTQSQIAKKLQDMDIPAEADCVFTSSMATAKFIRQRKKNARCYVIGEDGLADALEQEGLIIVTENADYVVVGIDRAVTYDKLAAAALAVQNGAVFISTNSDRAIPAENGFLPGNGALTSVITVSTGKSPIFIGKPETIIMDEALKTIGYPKEHTLMVGDNFDTDIMAGINTGMDTLMVFTGITPFTMFEQLPVKPTHYVHNLTEWLDFI